MAGTLAGIEVREGNERGRQEGENICIRNRWEGDMSSSQHKSSPHQARAFRRELDLVTSAEISLSRRIQRCSMHFSYGYQTVQ